MARQSQLSRFAEIVDAATGKNGKNYEFQSNNIHRYCIENLHCPDVRRWNEQQLEQLSPPMVAHCPALAVAIESTARVKMNS